MLPADAGEAISGGSMKSDGEGAKNAKTYFHFFLFGMKCHCSSSLNPWEKAP